MEAQVQTAGALHDWLVAHKLDDVASCTVVRHPHVMTVEAMQQELAKIGTVSETNGNILLKNLFLKSKKSRDLLLVSVPENYQIKLKDLEKQLGYASSNSLRFASSEVLLEKLGVKEGCVTPFGLINDTDALVKFVTLQSLWQDEAACVLVHPLENDKTTLLPIRHLKALLRATGHEPVLLDTR